MSRPIPKVSPPTFHLDIRDPDSLRGYLERRNFPQTDSPLTLEKAGEGNMNCVLRARFADGSVIVKQARPWVEKYPSIAAPIERAASEARFYRRVSREPDLAARLPRLLDCDEDSSILILEDLGAVSPVGDCYQGTGFLAPQELTGLADFLAGLHGLEVASEERADFRNWKMRQLNHEHIFDLPMRTDGSLAAMLDGITPGLHEAGEVLRQNSEYQKAVKELGHRYLHLDGAALLHGDLFPGSLLRGREGKLFVIDPEFCFLGDPEFDLGVFYAHLLLSGHPAETAAFWLAVALQDRPDAKPLTLQYAGVEIMRRLLGVAQLPVSLPLEAKRSLLEQSRRFVLAGSVGCEKLNTRSSQREE